MEQRKILGIIGGLGPMASAQFLELLTAMTDAAADQDHIETILYSKPQTPDRTAFLLRNSTENPLPDLIDSGKKLERLGAQVLAIPCMTAYGFYDALADAFQAKLIHPILKTAELLKKYDVRAAGIMATDGSLQSGIFVNALRSNGIRPILPDEAHQAMVMEIIYRQVKCGRPADLGTFETVRAHLAESGAEITLLGCTELSVVKQMQPLSGGYLDMMEVLAASALEACGYRVREERMPRPAKGDK